MTVIDRQCFKHVIAILNRISKNGIVIAMAHCQWVNISSHYNFSITKYFWNKLCKKRTKNYWPISDEHLNYLTTLSVNYNFKWMYYTISKNLKLHSFQKLEVVEHRKISINGEFQCADTCVGGHISDFVTFILFKNVHKVVCWSLTVINGVIDAFWLAGFECACG